MPWRMRTQVWVDFVPAGIGPMSGSLSPMSGGAGGSGPSQQLEFFNTAGGYTVPGGGAGGTLQAADITTLLASLTTDISAQANAALGRLNGFATGAG
jgi:hypothetical protein